MHCAPCTPEKIKKKKTFRVVENRCLQCVESIFVNLPQFAKSGLKESLNRFFWYFSLHLFGYFGLVSSLLFLWVFVSLRFLISGEMVKKLLAASSTDSVFAEFLLHWMLMFNWKQRSRWNHLKAKQASQSNMNNNALFNLTYEASDILNVNLSSGVSL